MLIKVLVLPCVHLHNLGSQSGVTLSQSGVTFEDYETFSSVSGSLELQN